MQDHNGWDFVRWIQEYQNPPNNAECRDRRFALVTEIHVVFQAPDQLF